MSCMWRLCAGGDWFCSATCAVACGRQTDHVRNYSLAVCWYGLLDLCHRDAIREADGPAMMSMWRINMVRFWNGHHNKYLATGHRLLAGIMYALFIVTVMGINYFTMKAVITTFLNYHKSS